MKRFVISTLVLLGFILLSQTVWSQSVVLLPADDDDFYPYDLPQFLNDGTDSEYFRFDEIFAVRTAKLDGTSFLLQASYDHNELMVLKADYREKPLTDRVALEAPETQSGAWNLRFDSSLLENHFDVYGEWDFGAFDPEVENGFDETQQRYDVAFKGKLGRFSYGARHRSTGKNYNPLSKENDHKKKLRPDKAGNEIWTAWWYDKIGLKASVSEVWNNLKNNPDKPRLTTDRVGITLNYMHSSWPYLGYSLAYFQGTRRSSREPVNYKPHQDPIEEVTTGIYYAGNVWDASLYSSYSSTGDASQTSNLPTSIWTHDLSASYYPTSTLSITPALGYYIENYSQFDTETVTRAASMTFSYTPKDKNLQLTLYGAYDAVTNETWGQDANNFYLDNALVWTLPASSPLEMGHLSFHATYNRYRDAINTNSDSDDLAVWVVFSRQSPAGLRLMPALGKW